MVQNYKNENFEVTIDYDPDLNYVAVYNGHNFFRKIIIKNLSPKIINNLAIKISGFYFPEISFELTAIGAQKYVDIDGSKIIPALDKLILLAEGVYSEISLTVNSGTRELFECRIPINIQAWNFWESSQSHFSDIASFVMPNHEYPVELLAKGARILKETDIDNSLNGYEASSFEKFFRQIDCVWRAIATEDIKYLTQIYNGTEGGQKIITVDMIKRFRQGNCLDLSILLCSCLERLNLCPLLVFVPGHVLVGIWLNPYDVLESPVSFESKTLSKNILDKKKPKLIVLESTHLRFHTSNASEAIELALNTIKNNKIDYAVDIVASRVAGIRPLPFAFSPTDLIENEKPEIAGYKYLTSSSQRQEGWERKLLDISLRNPMLNLKPGKKILKLQDKGIDAIIESLKSNTLGNLVDCEEKDREEKLKEIYRSARSAIEETGANNLFLALGSLVWFDVDNDKPHIAPLIFIPATIVRKKAMCYEIRLRDEEEMLNVTLIEMMRQMFGVKFEELDPMPMDENGIPAWKIIFETFEAHIREINRSQATDRKWQINDKSYLGIFSFTKFLMWNDIHNHPGVVVSNSILLGMIENIYKGSDISSETMANEFEDDIILPIDFDSSQLKAVTEAHKGSSFVLYGPPGTGKSQTITNMIADALYNGKKVLFVAEKKAALDVVQTRLDKIGLSPFCLELHSNKTDKRSFFSQIEASKISILGKGVTSTHDEIFNRKKSVLKTLSEKLEETVNALHDSREQGLSVYDSICGFLEKGYQEIVYKYHDIRHLSHSEMNMLCSEIASLDIVCELLGIHPGESSLVGLYPKQNTIENQQAITETVKKLPDSLLKARKKANGIINRIFRHKKPEEILGKDPQWQKLISLANLIHRDFSDFKGIERKVKEWQYAIRELRKWYYFSDKVNAINNFGVPEVIDHFLEAHTGKETSEAVKAGVLKSIIDYHLDNDPFLRTFNGLLHETEIGKYRKVAEEFKEISISHLIETLEERLKSSILNPAEQQQLAVLMRRLLSRGRGVSLRKIITDSFEILQQVFPCMLMSPLSVAQYLQMNSGMFDSVIFDEASQMETADSIGTIARGNAIIVVGDPKQLPPTRFFTSQTTGGEEIEESEDANSILEDCITLGFPSLYLTRHYRSRHESLISFSNRNFYDDKLMTFPSVNDNEKKVRLIDPEGIYDIGKTRTNRIEAEAVVKFIIELVGERETTPSIGVVAFSKSQSNLIEDILNTKLQRNKAIQKKLDECHEPIFIKNLENVQGDERDIIIFSIGYGPDKDGNVSLNFGPINQSGGERRLNVAVSRAREEMIVFTSLKPYHIPKERIISKGVETLRSFLEYASGIEDLKEDIKQENLKDSVILQIVRRLRKTGLQVRTHLGRSSYKIDLAVVDKDNPNSFSLGIIIDGYNYSAQPSSRDREIVIPGVLENLGWKIHRVWVLDWLTNSTQVIENIISKISSKN